MWPLDLPGVASRPFPVGQQTAKFDLTMFIEEEAGQLFRDIAIAISSAVFLSLLVSITVIPALSAKFLKGGAKDKRARSIIERSGTRVVNVITGFVAWLINSFWRKLLTALVLMGMAAVTAMVLIPETEYLPVGNRNFIFGLLLPPPGYNKAHMAEIADRVAADMRPYWEAEVGSNEAKALKGPPVDNFFFFV